MDHRIVFVALLFLGAGSAHAQDLTGIWKDDAGSPYRIRQIGTSIYWDSSALPWRDNIFIGTLSGDTITGEWIDMPGGTSVGSGKLTLKVEGPAKMTKTGQSANYGGSVWTREAAATPSPVAGVAPPASAAAPGAPSSSLAACYVDSGDATGTAGRDLSGDILNDPKMTVEMCVSHCASKHFAYAGVQYGTFCFCGDSYGKYGPSPYCATPCAGNAAELCGGTWTNMIYAVAGFKPGSATSSPSGSGGGPCADSTLQATMDEWLNSAIPLPEGTWHYEPWGRAVGTSPTTTVTAPLGKPDTTLSRCEWLRQLASQLPSKNLGTLAEYLTAHGYP